MLEFQDTAISCGIRQVYNIQDFYNKFESEFKIKFIKELLDFYEAEADEDNEGCAQGSPYALTIGSINSEEPELAEILDSICTHKTDWFNNPNSGNEIKLYTFTEEKLKKLYKNEQRRISREKVSN